MDWMTKTSSPRTFSSMATKISLSAKRFTCAHASTGCQGLEQHPYNQQVFVDNWSKLWRMVACLPNFKSEVASLVFVDVMNESDSMNIKWEPSVGRPGAHQLYLGTADALWQLTPEAVMFFFEGEGGCACVCARASLLLVLQCYHCRMACLLHAMLPLLQSLTPPPRHHCAHTVASPQALARTCLA